MITAADILMGRDKTYPLSEGLKTNLHNLVKAVNMLEMICPYAFVVSSGYRPPAINAKVARAAPNSAHAVCMAVDLADKDGTLDQWCLDNLKELEIIGLFLEDPKNTPGWCHLTTRAPKSGNRVFKP